MAGVANDGYQQILADQTANAKDAIAAAAGTKVPTRADAQARALDFIKDLKNGDLSQNSTLKQGLAFFLKYLVKPLIVVIMAYVWLAKKVYSVYILLPMNVVQMIFGLGLCFLGGPYFASLAAIEAFRQFGGKMLWDELQIVWDEATMVAAASDKDDKVDANNDGIVDVNQMTTNEYITHKGMVAMIAVSDPTKLSNAVTYLMTTYISVLATLKMQFARTVAFALAIAEQLETPLVSIAGPPLAMALGKDLAHWVPTILGTTIKIVAVGVASFIQSIISAFYSGLRGGKMFAESLIIMLGEQGIMDKLPESIAPKPWDPNKSYLDEIIAYPLAAFGFYYQFSHGFVMPAGNLVEMAATCLMFPLTVIEGFLRWQIFCP